jgi:hypothetical protein
VSLERELTAVTARLGVAYWKGRDGARLLDGLRLLPEDISCTETDTAPGVMRCTPSNETYTGTSFFESESCERPVSVIFSCDDLQVIRGPYVGGNQPPRGDGCPRPSTPAPLFRAERIESSTVYTTTAEEGVCTPTPFLGLDYFRRGPFVPFEEYPVVESTHEGAGRFQLVHAESEGRRLFARPQRLFDADVGAECLASELDGRTFCLPADQHLSASYVAFADPRCERPVGVFDSCVRALPRAVFAPQLQGGAGCATPPLLAVGPRREGTADTLYRLDTLDGRCSPDGGVAGAVLHELSPLGDPATLFPLLTPATL